MPAQRPRPLHRLITLATGITTAACLALAGAAPAGAAELDGYSEGGEFIIYGGPNTTSEVFDLYLSRNDLGKLSWPRYGGPVNDQNESYWNRDGLTWHVYTDSYRNGQHGWISPGVSSNATGSFWHRVSSAYYN
ncbi:peptidase inhibitor family I36 protein [Kitasatospora sp. NPDC096147]|uniref:peptidase inhibitor family I36 protein n=1 Tax=Kitasatospora sp. NPDC096147 TaxID=3364093 RepID=UPI003804502E